MKGEVYELVGLLVPSDFKVSWPYHRCGTTSTLITHQVPLPDCQQTPFQDELQLPSRPIKTSTDLRSDSFPLHPPIVVLSVPAVYIAPRCRRCAVLDRSWPRPLTTRKLCNANAGDKSRRLIVSTFGLSDILPLRARCRASTFER
jgi:hypothetical protein